MNTLPWLAPMLAAVVLLAGAACGPASRLLGTSRPNALLVLLGFGIVIALTLTPFNSPFPETSHPGSCDLRRVWFPSLQQLLAPGDTAANILMLVPLGLGVGWLRARPAAIVVGMAALALPFIVELTQLLIPGLGRACESADIVDNLTGLAVGFLVAQLVRKRSPSTARA